MQVRFLSRSVLSLSFRILAGFGLFAVMMAAFAQPTGRFHVADHFQVPAHFKGLARRSFELVGVPANPVYREGLRGLRISLVDADLSRSQTREAVAEILVRHELLRPLLQMARTNFLFLFPGDVARDAELEKRVVSVAVSALLGRLERHPDERAKLWWKLKFGGDLPETAPLRPGEQVLLGVHQLGYPGPGGVDLGAIDFGHSTLALRTIGGNGESDMLINPGAKDAVSGSEVDLPPSRRPDVLSMVRTTNLWNWSEWVLNHRGMRVTYYVFRISRTQRDALRLLARDGDRMVFGMAKAWGDNCADAAYDIIESILPAGQRLYPAMLGTNLPRWIFKGSASVLPFVASHDVRFHDKYRHIEGDYLTANFPVKAKTDAYRDFRAFEDSLLR